MDSIIDSITSSIDPSAAPIKDFGFESPPSVPDFTNVNMLIIILIEQIPNNGELAEFFATFPKDPLSSFPLTMNQKQSPQTPELPTEDEYYQVILYHSVQYLKKTTQKLMQVPSNSTAIPPTIPNNGQQTTIQSPLISDRIV